MNNLFSTTILNVWRINTKGKPIKIGQFAYDYKGNTFFKYDYEYINSKDAIAIDPFSLPLRQGIFRSRRLEPPFFAFDDTLPDAWGMAILEKRVKKRLDRYCALELIDTSGVGALFFSKNDKLSAPTWISISVLKECMEEAHSFELRQADMVFNYLQVSGTSAGGARPKASFVDDNGDVWLVKFPSRFDPDKKTATFVEYEGIEFAKQIDLPVPEAKVIEYPSGACLAVKRFDIIPDIDTPFKGRQALLSFRTICGGMEQSERGYEALSVFLRRISANPRQDILFFFRHMLLNCLILNTDDHLKNFSVLLHDEGWRLSPAYDLIGNLWGMKQHTTPVNGKKDNFSKKDFIEAGLKMGIKKEDIHFEICRALKAANIYLEKISNIPGTGQLELAIRKRLEDLGEDSSDT